MPQTLFTNVAIFDGSGKLPEPGEVLVEDKRIKAVVTGTQSIPRAGAELVDGGGATLMPGLIESHAHLSWPSSVGRLFTTRTLPPEEHMLITAHNARVTIDHGYTSAYSAGALGQRFEVALKREIEGGWLPGPRLKASSLERAPGDGVFGAPRTTEEHHGRGPDAMRAFIKSSAESGIDSVKLLLSGDDNFTPNGSQDILYSDEEVAAAGEQARESGIWLACHAQAAAAVKLGVRHGFRAIYHCSYADEEALDMLEAKKQDVFVGPAIGLAYAATCADQSIGLPQAQVERGHRILDLQCKLIPLMRKRGIRVLPGGDYGFPHNPIGRNARDLELFVSLLGYQPEEVLMAATKWGGELMGMGGELGQIRAGFLADLLLVRGDPVKNITILQERDNLLMIMKDGQYHKRLSGLHSGGVH